MRSLAASTTYPVKFSTSVAPDATPIVTAYADETSLGTMTVTATGGVNEYSAAIVLPGNVTEGQIITVAIDWSVGGTSQSTARLLVGQVGMVELVANAVSVGNGENAVTVTVQDSDTTAIQGARVTVVGTTLKQTSGSDGQVTFNLDAGSYTLRVSAPSGYSDPSDTAVTVDGTESVTITVSATGTVTPPDSPTLCTLAVLCVDTEGAAEVGVTVEAKLVEIPSSGTGVAYTAAKQSATSGADGIATLTLVRLAKYLVKRGTSIEWTEFTVPDAGTAEMTSFIGSP